MPQPVLHLHDAGQRRGRDAPVRRLDLEEDEALDDQGAAQLVQGLGLREAHARHHEDRLQRREQLADQAIQELHRGLPLHRAGDEAVGAQAVRQLGHALDALGSQALQRLPDLGDGGVEGLGLLDVAREPLREEVVGLVLAAGVGGHQRAQGLLQEREQSSGRRRHPAPPLRPVPGGGLDVAPDLEAQAVPRAVGARPRRLEVGKPRRLLEQGAEPFVETGEERRQAVADPAQLLRGAVEDEVVAVEDLLELAQGGEDEAQSRVLEARALDRPQQDAHALRQLDLAVPDPDHLARHARSPPPAAGVTAL